MTVQAEKKIAIAMRLGLLSDQQLELIEKKKAESSYPGVEIAIRNGYLDRNELDLINICSDPLDVVPGYRIDGLIGQGGVGVVFKATQLRMDRDVAIKTINQSTVNNKTAIKRFEREAQIVGNLRHPNIVSAFDFGLHNEKLYLVMEFVEGIDGERFLEQEVQLQELQAWHVALQICHALDYANQKGIIHRDIKPGNLILTQPPSGTQLPPNVPFVKIADFGLARFKDNPSDSSITIDHGISGTPFYMSPEQVTGQDIDHFSDIYALGVTLWHMIAGYPPINGSDPFAVITAKMKSEDDWLEQRPKEISAVGFELLKKMCRHKREDRLSDYSALVVEIKSVISELTNQSLSQTTDFVSSDKKFSAKTDVTLVEEFEGFAADQKAVATSTDNSTSRNSLSVSTTLDAQGAALTGGAPRRGNRTRVLALSLILLATACMAGLYAWSANAGWGANGSGRNAKIEPQVRLKEPAGFPVILFDGSHIDPRGQTPGSRWESATGAEGGLVLAGKGSKKFKCTDQDGNDLEYFSFSCGFRHHEADEIQFNWFLEPDSNPDQPPEDASEKAPAFQVVVDTTHATVFLGETKSGAYKLPTFDEDSFGYHQIRIESQPGYWRVAVGPEFFVNIPKLDDAQAGATIELKVTGEDTAHFAHFEALRFVPFKSPPLKTAPLADGKADGK